MKILIISTGGTIASKKDDNIHLDAPFKAVHFADENLIKVVELSFSCPYTILSENMDFSHLQSLVDEIKESDSDNIIILHGSDTLAFTSSFIANLFWDKNIVLTASDKPIEDNSANGISNFNEALRHIKKGKKGKIKIFATQYNEKVKDILYVSKTSYSTLNLFLFVL